MVLTETIQDIETVECQFSTWRLTHPLCSESLPPSSGPGSVALCWSWLLSTNVSPPLLGQEAGQGCRHGPTEEEGSVFILVGISFVKTKTGCDDEEGETGAPAPRFSVPTILSCPKKRLMEFLHRPTDEQQANLKTKYNVIKRYQPFLFPIFPPPPTFPCCVFYCFGPTSKQKKKKKKKALAKLITQMSFGAFCTHWAVNMWKMIPEVKK